MDTPYTQLPVEYDPSSKTVVAREGAASAASASNSNSGLTDELAALNALHKALTAGSSAPAPASGGEGASSSSSSGWVPPPPTAANPKRSAQVAKLRDSGNAAFRAGRHADAVRLYTLGIDMAAGRPAWEPAPPARDELAQLYANRAQAHMALQAWAEGAVDALCSVELKKQGNTKAWWRRAKCLLEMGRLDEADRWLVEACEFEGEESDLIDIGKQVRKAQERAGKSN
jgi:translocation protein SEC72